MAFFLTVEIACYICPGSQTGSLFYFANPEFFKCEHNALEVDVWTPEPQALPFPTVLCACLSDIYIYFLALSCLSYDPSHIWNLLFFLLILFLDDFPFLK